jgi:hypothetical protein
VKRAESIARLERGPGCSAASGATPTARSLRRHNNKAPRDLLGHDVSHEATNARRRHVFSSSCASSFSWLHSGHIGPTSHSCLNSVSTSGIDPVTICTATTSQTKNFLESAQRHARVPALATAALSHGPDRDVRTRPTANSYRTWDFYDDKTRSPLFGGSNGASTKSRLQGPARR